MKTGTYVVLFARIVVGAVLIYASIDKITDPLEFSKAITNYHMLPWGLENLLAITLPWIELFVGVGLLAGIYLDGAALVAQSLMLVFILAIGSAILRGIDIECGCGLKDGEMVGVPKILEDLVYYGLALLIYFLRERGFLELLK